MKKKLTIEQHLIEGVRLKKIHRDFLEQFIDISGAFGKSSKISRIFHRALRALGKARCEIDEEYYRAGGEGNSPYYGAD